MNPIVLLVEDQAIIAMGNKLQLEKLGYTVLTAYSGEAAVEMVRENSAITLVLMDIDLGTGMDGTEAAQQILRNRDIPVVFLSSHSEPEIVTRTESITSYGYVVKNSAAIVLDASIKMALRLHAAHRREQELLEIAQHYLDVVAEIVLTLNTDGTIRMLNDSGHRLLGYAQGELVGKNWFECCIPASRRDEVRNLFTRSLSVTSGLHISYENPVLTRDGTERLISWHNTILLERGGSVAEVLSSGEDITRHSQLEAQLLQERELLRRQSELQQLLIDVGSLILPERESHSMIDQALQMLGNGIGADRAYIFAYDETNGIAINTHEWCAPGIEPQIEELQAVPLPDIDEAVSLHRQGQVHHIAAVDELPPGRLRSILEPQGIRSMMAVPIMDDGRCVGSVGFDFVRESHRFSTEEQGVLTVFSRRFYGIRWI